MSRQLEKLEKRAKLAEVKVQKRAARAAAEANFWSGLENGNANRISTGTGKLTGTPGIDRAARNGTQKT